jgi:hypothetical protein
MLVDRLPEHVTWEIIHANRPMLPDDLAVVDLVNRDDCDQPTITVGGIPLADYLAAHPKLA